MRCKSRQFVSKKGVMAYPQIQKQILDWIKGSGFVPGTRLETQPLEIGKRKDKVVSWAHLALGFQTGRSHFGLA